MQDRVSLYPGRVKLEPVAGQANTYDLTRADSPTQEGTPLNKASLLKDSTAALFGLGADAVPDDVFNNLLGQLGDKARIATGSYTGTGTYGSSNPNSITLSFVPKLVIVFGWCYIAAMSPTTSTYNNKEIADFCVEPNAGWAVYGDNPQTKIDGTTVYWYGSAAQNAHQQGNYKGYKYQYFAFG